jgi:hypothetical protein
MYVCTYVCMYVDQTLCTYLHSQAKFRHVSVATTTTIKADSNTAQTTPLSVCVCPVMHTPRSARSEYQLTTHSFNSDVWNKLNLTPSFYESRSHDSLTHRKENCFRVHVIITCSVFSFRELDCLVCSVLF